MRRTGLEVGEVFLNVRSGDLVYWGPPVVLGIFGQEGDGYLQRGKVRLAIAIAGSERNQEPFRRLPH